MDLSTDDLLRGLVRRVDELEAARSDLASRVEALRGDNDSLRRETRGLQQVTGRLKQKVDGLTRDNAILREEIASLKYGESTAAKSRKRPKTEHLALTTIGNDATVHIASFLDAEGIARLGRTCGYFGKGFVGSDGQMTSLAEELAGQVFDGSASDYEKSALLGGRKIRMLHELEQMRLPLYFEQLVGNGGNVIKYVEPHHDMSSISIMSCSGDDATSDATAISNHVMRTGKHYVTFCISFENVNSLLDFGVVRPIKDLDKICHGSFDPLCWHRHDHKHREQLLAEKTDEWGNDLHCCCFESERGRCFCADWSDEDHGAGDDDDWVGDGWDGMEPLNGIGDCTVGLLLDLNRGTLSVFKDDRMLGVMKEGLTGAYCWYVCCTEATCEVEIERGMPPLTRNDGMVGANGKELDLVVKNLIGCIGGG